MAAKSVPPSPVTQDGADGGAAPQPTGVVRVVRAAPPSTVVTEEDEELVDASVDEGHGGIDYDEGDDEFQISDDDDEGEEDIMEPPPQSQHRSHMQIKDRASEMQLKERASEMQIKDRASEMHKKTLQPLEHTPTPPLAPRHQRKHTRKQAGGGSRQKQHSLPIIREESGEEEGEGGGSNEALVAGGAQADANSRRRQMQSARSQQQFTDLTSKKRRHHSRREGSVLAASAGASAAVTTNAGMGIPTWVLVLLVILVLAVLYSALSTYFTSAKQASLQERVDSIVKTSRSAIGVREEERAAHTRAIQQLQAQVHSLVPAVKHVLAAEKQSEATLSSLQARVEAEFGRRHDDSSENAGKEELLEEGGAGTPSTSSSSEQRGEEEGETDNEGIPENGDAGKEENAEITTEEQLGVLPRGGDGAIIESDPDPEPELELEPDQDHVDGEVLSNATRERLEGVPVVNMRGSSSSSPFVSVLMNLAGVAGNNNEQ